ncbi:MAG: hypothetical protein AB8I08_22590 [Sandaracinaceae bacterium]
MRGALPLLIIVCLGGCGLLVEPQRHIGERMEAGTGLDAGTPVDAWVPECSDNAECGPSLVTSCVAGRCTDCAPTLRYSRVERGIGVEGVHVATVLVDGQRWVYAAAHERASDGTRTPLLYASRWEELGRELLEPRGVGGWQGRDMVSFSFFSTPADVELAALFRNGPSLIEARPVGAQLGAAPTQQLLAPDGAEAGSLRRFAEDGFAWYEVADGLQLVRDGAREVPTQTGSPADALAGWVLLNGGGTPGRLVLWNPETGVSGAQEVPYVAQAQLIALGEDRFLAVNTLTGTSRLFEVTCDMDGCAFSDRLPTPHAHVGGFDVAVLDDAVIAVGVARVGQVDLRMGLGIAGRDYQPFAMDLPEHNGAGTLELPFPAETDIVGTDTLRVGELDSVPVTHEGRVSIAFAFSEQRSNAEFDPVAASLYVGVLEACRAE